MILDRFGVVLLAPATAASRLILEHDDLFLGILFRGAGDLIKFQYLTETLPGWVRLLPVLVVLIVDFQLVGHLILLV